MPDPVIVDNRQTANNTVSSEPVTDHSLQDNSLKTLTNRLTELRELVADRRESIENSQIFGAYLAEQVQAMLAMQAQTQATSSAVSAETRLAQERAILEIIESRKRGVQDEEEYFSPSERLLLRHIILSGQAQEPDRAMLKAMSQCVEGLNATSANKLLADIGKAVEGTLASLGQSDSVSQDPNEIERAVKNAIQASLTESKLEFSESGLDKLTQLFTEVLPGEPNSTSIADELVKIAEKIDSNQQLSAKEVDQIAQRLVTAFYDIAPEIKRADYIDLINGINEKVTNQKLASATDIQAVIADSINELVSINLVENSELLYSNLQPVIAEIIIAEVEINELRLNEHFQQPVTTMQVANKEQALELIKSAAEMQVVLELLGTEQGNQAAQYLQKQFVADLLRDNPQLAEQGVTFAGLRERMEADYQQAEGDVPVRRIEDISSLTAELPESIIVNREEREEIRQLAVQLERSAFAPSTENCRQLKNKIQQLSSAELVSLEVQFSHKHTQLEYVTALSAVGGEELTDWVRAMKNGDLATLAAIEVGRAVENHDIPATELDTVLQTLELGVSERTRELISARAENATSTIEQKSSDSTANLVDKESEQSSLSFESLQAFEQYLEAATKELAEQQAAAAYFNKQVMTAEQQAESLNELLTRIYEKTSHPPFSLPEQDLLKVALLKQIEQNYSQERVRLSALIQNELHQILERHNQASSLSSAVIPELEARVKSLGTEHGASAPSSELVNSEVSNSFHAYCMTHVQEVYKSKVDGLVKELGTASLSASEIAQKTNQTSQEILSIFQKFHFEITLDAINTDVTNQVVQALAVVDIDKIKGLSAEEQIDYLDKLKVDLGDERFNLMVDLFYQRTGQPLSYIVTLQRDTENDSNSGRIAKFGGSKSLFTSAEQERLAKALAQEGALELAQLNVELKNKAELLKLSERQLLESLKYTIQALEVSFEDHLETDPAILNQKILDLICSAPEFSTLRAKNLSEISVIFEKAIKAVTEQSVEDVPDELISFFNITDNTVEFNSNQDILDKLALIVTLQTQIQSNLKANEQIKAAQEDIKKLEAEVVNVTNLYRDICNELAISDASKFFQDHVDVAAIYLKNIPVRIASAEKELEKNQLIAERDSAEWVILQRRVNRYLSVDPADVQRALTLVMAFKLSNPPRSEVYQQSVNKLEEGVTSVINYQQQIVSGTVDKIETLKQRLQALSELSKLIQEQQNLEQKIKEHQSSEPWSPWRIPYTRVTAYNNYLEEHKKWTLTGQELNAHLTDKIYAIHVLRAQLIPNQAEKTNVYAKSQVDRSIGDITRQIEYLSAHLSKDLPGNIKTQVNNLLKNVLKGDAGTIQTDLEKHYVRDLEVLKQLAARIAELKDAKVQWGIANSNVTSSASPVRMPVASYDINKYSLYQKYSKEGDTELSNLIKQTERQLGISFGYKNHQDLNDLHDIVESRIKSIQLCQEIANANSESLTQVAQQADTIQRLKQNSRLGLTAAVLDQTEFAQTDLIHIERCKELLKIIESDPLSTPTPEVMQQARALIPVDTKLGKILQQVDPALTPEEQLLRIGLLSGSELEVNKFTMVLAYCTNPELCQELFADTTLKLTTPESVSNFLRSVDSLPVENDELAQVLNEQLISFSEMQISQLAEEHFLQIPQNERASFNTAFTQFSGGLTPGQALISRLQSHTGSIRSNMLIEYAGLNVVANDDLQAYYSDTGVPDTLEHRQYEMQRLIIADQQVDITLAERLAQCLGVEQINERAVLLKSIPVLRATGQNDKAITAEQRLQALDLEFNSALGEFTRQFSTDQVRRLGVNEYVQQVREVNTYQAAAEIFSPDQKTTAIVDQLFGRIWAATDPSNTGKKLQVAEALEFLRSQNLTPQELQILQIQYYELASEQSRAGISGNLLEDLAQLEGSSLFVGNDLEKAITHLATGTVADLTEYDLIMLSAGMRTGDEKLTARAMLGLAVIEGTQEGAAYLAKKSQELLTDASDAWRAIRDSEAYQTLAEKGEQGARYIGMAALYMGEKSVETWQAFQQTSAYKMAGECAATVFNFTVDSAEFAALKLYAASSYAVEFVGPYAAEFAAFIKEYGSQGLTWLNSTLQASGLPDFVSGLAARMPPALQNVWSCIANSDFVGASKDLVIWSFNGARKIGVDTLAFALELVPDAEQRRKMLNDLNEWAKSLPNNFWYVDGQGPAFVQYVKIKGGAYGDTYAKLFERMLSSAGLSAEQTRRFIATAKVIDAQLLELDTLNQRRTATREAAVNFFATVGSLDTKALIDRDSRWLTYGTADQVLQAHTKMKLNQKNLIDQQYDGLQDIGRTSALVLQRGRIMLDDILEDTDSGIRVEHSRDSIRNLRRRDAARDWRVAREDAVTLWRHEHEIASQALARVDFLCEVARGVGAVASAVTGAVLVSWIPGLNVGAWAGVAYLIGGLVGATGFNLADKSYRGYMGQLSGDEAFNKFWTEFAIDVATLGAMKLIAKPLQWTSRFFRGGVYGAEVVGEAAAKPGILSRIFSPIFSRKEIGIGVYRASEVPIEAVQRELGKKLWNELADWFGNATRIAIEKGVATPESVALIKQISSLNLRSLLPVLPFIGAAAKHDRPNNALDLPLPPELKQELPDQGLQLMLRRFSQHNSQSEGIIKEHDQGTNSKVTIKFNSNSLAAFDQLDPTFVDRIGKDIRATVAEGKSVEVVIQNGEVVSTTISSETKSSSMPSNTNNTGSSVNGDPPPSTAASSLNSKDGKDGSSPGGGYGGDGTGFGNTSVGASANPGTNNITSANSLPGSSSNAVTSSSGEGSLGSQTQYATTSSASNIGSNSLDDDALVKNNSNSGESSAKDNGKRAAEDNELPPIIVQPSQVANNTQAISSSNNAETEAAAKGLGIQMADEGFNTYTLAEARAKAEANSAANSAVNSQAEDLSEMVAAKPVLNRNSIAEQNIHSQVSEQLVSSAGYQNAVSQAASLADADSENIQVKVATKFSVAVSEQNVIADQNTREYSISIASANGVFVSQVNSISNTNTSSQQVANSQVDVVRQGNQHGVQVATNIEQQVGNSYTAAVKNADGNTTVASKVVANHSANNATDISAEIIAQKNNKSNLNTAQNIADSNSNNIPHNQVIAQSNAAFMSNVTSNSFSNGNGHVSQATNPVLAPVLEQVAKVSVNGNHSTGQSAGLTQFSSSGNSSEFREVARKEVAIKANSERHFVTVALEDATSRVAITQKNETSAANSTADIVLAGAQEKVWSKNADKVQTAVLAREEELETSESMLLGTEHTVKSKRAFKAGQLIEEINQNIDIDGMADELEEGVDREALLEAQELLTGQKRNKKIVAIHARNINQETADELADENTAKQTRQHILAEAAHLSAEKAATALSTKIQEEANDSAAINSSARKAKKLSKDQQLALLRRIIFAFLQQIMDSQNKKALLWELIEKYGFAIDPELLEQLELDKLLEEEYEDQLENPAIQIAQENGRVALLQEAELNKQAQNEDAHNKVTAQPAVHSGRTRAQLFREELRKKEKMQSEG